MSEKYTFSVPQITHVFEYQTGMGTIKVFFIKAENVKAALMTLEYRVFSYVNLTYAYDFASSLVKKASSKWERDANGYYPNPFKALREDKQAFEKLREILNNIYFGDNA